MGAQEGCRDGPVGDVPSGGDVAWGVFVCYRVCFVTYIASNAPWF